LRERDHLETQGINKRIILKGISRKKYWDLDWVDLILDTKRWQAIVKAVVKLRITKNAGNCQRAFESVPNSCLENLIGKVGVENNILNYQWEM
jgi:hypothetical protein